MSRLAGVEGLLGDRLYVTRAMVSHQNKEDMAQDFPESCREGGDVSRQEPVNSR